jgi:hypothetical protein
MLLVLVEKRRDNRTNMPDWEGGTVVDEIVESKNPSKSF